MPILPYQQKVIDIMIRHEKEMRELYLVYAQKFPSHQLFWQDLAKEELGHASTVALIGTSLEQGKATFNEKRFKTAAIGLSLSYINEKIAQAKNEELALFSALSITYDIEKSLIENSYFAILSEDSPDLQSILALLQKGAQRHLDKAKKAWEKEKLNSLAA